MNGLLIIDHGSRKAEANLQLIEVAGLVRALRTDVLVGWGHMEIAAPTIAEGFSTLVDQGATHIVLLPYFLSTGRHVLEDIPRLAAAAAGAHVQAGITYRVAEALGPHPLLAKLLLQRAGL
jgi:sirohydrochlorin ferrochelatase